MSESGVKKILNGKDASFDRVSSMARVLGLELWSSWSQPQSPLFGKSHSHHDKEFSLSRA